MKRRKDDDPPPPKAKCNKEKAVDHGFPSLFSQTQTNLFKNTSFEASDDDFQETPLLRKGKNVHTILKAAKEGTSAPGPSDVVINENASMPVVNKDTSAQAVSPAPIPYTSCTSAPTKASKKYQSKVDKTEVLKKEKEKNKVTGNEQKQMCFMNKSKTKPPKPKDTVEKTFVIKTSLANTCRYPKFVTLEEYYNLCGYNLATRRRKEHQEYHLDEFKYINELPTLKNCKLNLIFTSCPYTSTKLSKNSQLLLSRSQKLKFKTYINKQKGTQEIVKRLFDNSKKYGTSSTVGAKN
ncbi:uncharacterized protein RHIMIDRAFT_251162 [Rhizopus microsporus ATCC 52813]|uniref:Uncharacterized protein n=1 Tax=Rhizopus microsporus ATCC 52813 TaxID=1340429 RepID=A0A2G4SWB3_RHIZD|nr:uncharacterized protein RHIMIDRAFT_251154 [Rhizopus microsporus ATCC 52813]XP_023466786.1 uncharacterized protein RHIMIDRAFT_251162 [Rhizopus microsporus ATCC 52813]PHZ13067.1 hypothetical protein RHIMIDRAFT_251154 [Rhizopus microsporus ATCC 52813]PHZ13078.1 hypothetical protein RHIMIDRAFT_251162 [Rhizopus microsporus ATCC 52813]